MFIYFFGFKNYLYIFSLDLKTLQSSVIVHLSVSHFTCLSGRHLKLNLHNTEGVIPTIIISYETILSKRQDHLIATQAKSLDIICNSLYTL